MVKPCNFVENIACVSREPFKLFLAVPCTNILENLCIRVFYFDNFIIGGGEIWTLTISFGNSKRCQPIELQASWLCIKVFYPTSFVIEQCETSLHVTNYISFIVMCTKEVNNLETLIEPTFDKSDDQKVLLWLQWQLK